MVSILQRHDFMHLGACTVSHTDKKNTTKKPPPNLGKTQLEQLEEKKEKE